MSRRFVSGDRDQVFLLPPDMRDWLPESDLAWTVIDAVAQLEVSEFDSAYRADGRSRPAYDPAVMVALLLFAYCDGVRSSRQIERRCERDVAYRVVSRNLRPDHATIARFRARHRPALVGVFTQVLRLCAQAGLLRVGVVALDGTKMAAPASARASRTGAELDADIAAVASQVEAMLAQAEQTDAAEDAEHGSDRGDQPPPGLASRQARLTRLQQAKAELDAHEQAEQARQDEVRAAWEAERAAGRRPVGRPPGTQPPKGQRSRARVNVTDPDSRPQKNHRGFVQGYNAQAVVGGGQIIVAADVQSSPSDSSALHPMLDQAQTQLAAAGVTTPIRGALADSGYGGKDNLSRPRPITLLVGTSSGRTKTVTTPPRDPHVAAMARRTTSPAGRRLFRRRAGMVEPVFGQIKNRLGNNLNHRGLEAAKTEWTLITTSHNLLKYWRATTPAPA